MPELRNGSRSWSMSRDRDGHREYKITHIVLVAQGEGPANALTCPGLPAPGDQWILDLENDPWATCKEDATVTPYEQSTGESPSAFLVEQTFSTKGDDKRCKDQQFDDPLLMPPKISGNQNKYNEEALFDRFGNRITNSAHEQFKGPQVEFDANRMVIKIEQNVATAVQGYVLPAVMLNTVNAYPLWGYPARCIKLSAAPWELKFYGSCSYYYARTLEFDIFVITDPETTVRKSGFDRDLRDEATKVLNGHWDKGIWVLDNVNLVAPNPRNPRHFIAFKDFQGENIRGILDGAGKPAGSKATGAATTILTAQNIPNGTTALAPDDQPPSPLRLILEITDDDVSIDGGEIHIQGTDQNDAPIDEVFEPFVGTTSFQTQNEFKTVTAIVLDSISGAVPPDAIFIYTDQSVIAEGKIHVEKYDESDFELLGIPTVF